MTSSLLLDILSTDFCFVSKKELKSSYNLINIFEINKNLKQIVTILLLIKKNPKNNIYIITENKFIYNLTKNFINFYLKNNNIFLLSNFSSLKKEKISNNLNLLITLAFDFEKINERKLLRKFLQNDFFLIYNVSINKYHKFMGTYVLNNTIDDYKKLIFLLVLIAKILNK